ncbi:MAG TPA: tyrosine--tRNA ligase [Actinomycetota bacterium]|nr:tyrosine--tRNA ligase [Actinomycetota bacterium]
MAFPEVSRQLETLLAGGAQAIPAEELEAKLRAAEGRPLRVKLGIDPSAPDLHLGHAVVLGALRRFQELGHTAVLIIGDFTGRIGDPSGQSETRPMLTVEELDANARTYLEQAAKVLDTGAAEIRRNSEWLGGLSFADVATLASTQTVARLLQREDFAERYATGRPISLVEFLYPLMQGYDSVAVEADVEIGGTDQTFNLLVGRDVQRIHGQDPQVAFTLPLLVGTDGERKMSKSLGNHVGLTDPPEEQFGKVMSIPDALIVPWFRLCTGLGPEELDGIEAGLAEGSLHPAEQKRRLAREVVVRYHGEEAARATERRFDQVFRQHEVPEDVTEVDIPSEAVEDGRTYLPRLMVAIGLAESNSDARRLIEQGGVRLDGEPVGDPNAEVPASDLAGRVLQVGRRRFVRFR